MVTGNSGAPSRILWQSSDGRYFDMFTGEPWSSQPRREPPRPVEFETEIVDATNPRWLWILAILVGIALLATTLAMVIG